MLSRTARLVHMALRNKAMARHNRITQLVATAAAMVSCDTH